MKVFCHPGYVNSVGMALSDTHEEDPALSIGPKLDCSLSGALIADCGIQNIFVCRAFLCSVHVPSCLALLWEWDGFSDCCLYPTPVW